MTTPKETMTAIPKEGDQAPRFNLKSYPPGEVKLDDYIGKKNVILAFYPKDDTPGCTKEMCTFSEDLSKFENANTVVFGISCDDVASHEKFATKYDLKHKLLADEGGRVGRQYGTVTEGKSNASRVLFVIDKKGMIQRIIEGMPDNNQLLEIVSKLG
ncbi:MAG TPA: peroxiredoxin [Candidatus Obscuribacterales bacterium]